MTTSTESNKPLTNTEQWAIRYCERWVKSLTRSMDYDRTKKSVQQEKVHALNVLIGRIKGE